MCLMVKGQLHGIHSGGGSPFNKNSDRGRQMRMSDLTPVKNGLISAGVHMMSGSLMMVAR